MDNNNNVNNNQPVQPQPVQPQQGYQQPVQPQYQQQVQQPQGYPPQFNQQYQPMPNNQPDDPQKQKKRKLGLTLCIISIVLMFIALFSLFFFCLSFEFVDEVRYMLFSGFLFPYIASWVLLIIARVKSKNLMSKIMIFAYIGLVIGTIILAIFTVMVFDSCGSVFDECRGCLK